MSSYPIRRILAPYVATPPAIVARMLELAAVGPRDTVCDLGCGDGRICIEAARRYGARAVGVDFEAYWIEQAELNARAAGVTELVTFWQGDACDYDVSEATVVTLYLVQTSMQVVAREVLVRAQPGTRVVSHWYPIEGCEAERTKETIDPDGDTHRIYLWIVGEGGGLLRERAQLAGREDRVDS